MLQLKYVTLLKILLIKGKVDKVLVKIKKNINKTDNTVYTA
jgi:hypothetical protein